jgi:hypothetical protein
VPHLLPAEVLPVVPVVPDELDEHADMPRPTARASVARPAGYRTLIGRSPWMWHSGDIQRG